MSEDSGAAVQKCAKDAASHDMETPAGRRAANRAAAACSAAAVCAAYGAAAAAPVCAEVGAWIGDRVADAWEAIFGGDNGEAERRERRRREWAEVRTFIDAQREIDQDTADATQSAYEALIETWDQLFPSLAGQLGSADAVKPWEQTLARELLYAHGADFDKEAQARIGYLHPPRWYDPLGTESNPDWRAYMRTLRESWLPAWHRQLDAALISATADMSAVAMQAELTGREPVSIWKAIGDATEPEAADGSSSSSSSSSGGGALAVAAVLAAVAALAVRRRR